MADPTAPSHQVAEVGEVSFRSPQHRGQRPTSTAASLQIARGMGVHQSEGPITGGNGVLASLRSSPHGIAANIFLSRDQVLRQVGKSTIIPSQKKNQ